MFTFRDKVTSRGFIADVTTYGRLLAVHEDDGWWFCGVNPGGLASGGKTPRRPSAP
jgi:hypothetical protein